MSRSTTTSLQVLALVSLAAVLSACDTFRVTFPMANQVFSQDFQIVDGRLRILVRFDRAVDLASLIPRQNVVLETEVDRNADIRVIALSPTEIRIESVNTFGELFVFDPDGHFALILSGDGPQAIRDSAGTPLDGDGDGSPGGVYRTGLGLLG